MYQHHRQPVLEAFRAAAFFRQHRVEHGTRVQGGQGVFDRRPQRHVHRARGPRREQIEGGPPDNLGRLRPRFGVGADAVVERQLVDARGHGNMHEHEQLLGRDFSLRHHC